MAVDSVARRFYDPCAKLMIQGQLTKLVTTAKIVTARGGNPAGGIRGKVTGFSRASRKRMIELILTLGEAIPIFITVTYGKTWPEDPSEWKSHLDAFGKRMRRTYPNVSAIWRLEPQDRGAPHYHFLAYRDDGKAPFIPFDWVAKNWARVTGDTSPEHLAAGTRVERLKSHRGGTFYAAKYCAKVDEKELPKVWEKAGRVWGILNREALPIAPQRSRVLHSGFEQQAVIEMMRRNLVRGLEHREYKKICITHPELSENDKRDLAEFYVSQEMEEKAETEPWRFQRFTQYGDPVEFMDSVGKLMRGHPVWLAKELERSALVV